MNKERVSGSCPSLREQAAIAQLQAELAAQNSKVQTAPAWSHLGPSRATSGTGHLGPSLASLACQLGCTSRATSLVLQASAPSRPNLGESRALLSGKTRATRGDRWNSSSRSRRRRTPRRRQPRRRRTQRRWRSFSSSCSSSSSRSRHSRRLSREVGRAVEGGGVEVSPAGEHGAWPLRGGGLGGVLCGYSEEWREERRAGSAAAGPPGVSLAAVAKRAGYRLELQLFGWSRCASSDAQRL